MTVVEYTCARLEVFLAEISALKDSEFPYPHSKEALEILQAKFSEKLTRIQRKLPGVPSEQVNKECAIALKSLFSCLPLLGFILRSTNVRNAFEVYRPLLRLACNILEQGIGELFVYNDFLDLKSIALRLKSPSDTDKISLYIKSKLEGSTLDLLSRYTSGLNLRLMRALLNDLSRIAHGPLLCDQCDFSYVSLSPETKKLLSKKPAGKEAIRLNRFLLQDAYRSELAKLPRTRLLLSSEWNYSPFFIPEPSELKNYVLIGLPAPESSNPLLIPLAGHELGHSLWSRNLFAKEFRPVLKAHIIDIIQSDWPKYTQVFRGMADSPADLTVKAQSIDTYARAVDWGLRQIEETFCDFVAIRIFGRAYLHAFAYLLSPNHSNPRSLHYPNMKMRVKNIALCAEQCQLKKWAEFEDLFADLDEPELTDTDRYLLELADKGLGRCINALIKRVDDVLTESGIARPEDLLTEQETDRIYACFEKVIPAENAMSLSNILMAAWRAFENGQLWKTMPHIYDRKDFILKELVLKNIELFEYEHIMREAGVI